MHWFRQGLTSGLADMCLCTYSSFLLYFSIIWLSSAKNQYYVHKVSFAIIPFNMKPDMKEIFGNGWAGETNSHCLSFHGCSDIVIIGIFPIIAFNIASTYRREDFQNEIHLGTGYYFGSSLSVEYDLRWSLETEF